MTRKPWLTIYAGDELKRQIHEAAERAGKSDSTFCKELLVEALRPESRLTPPA